MLIDLKATNAREARTEAQKYAPCALHGYDTKGDKVYISFVRVRGDKAPVATATRDIRATKFQAEPKA